VSYKNIRYRQEKLEYIIYVITLMQMTHNNRNLNTDSTKQHKNK